MWIESETILHRRVRDSIPEDMRFEQRSEEVRELDIHMSGRKLQAEETANVKA